MAKFENKITDLPFASGVSRAQFKVETDVRVVDLAELSPERVSRQGEDLLIKLADGQWVRIDGFFSASGNASLLQTANGESFTAGMLLSMFPLLGADKKFAQANQDTLTDAIVSGHADTFAVARVKESAGDVKVVRSGSEIQLRPGDLVLDGDILVTGVNARANLEFFGNLSPGQMTVLGNGSIGPETRIRMSFGEADSANKGDGRAGLLCPWTRSCVPP